jgi:transcriptional regulator with XRE-family HTH domain
MNPQTHTSMPATEKKREYFHDKILANRLQVFRKQYIDKSQNKAAEKLGIPQSTLSFMESGKLAIRFEFIDKLVKGWKLNADWFRTGNGNPIDKTPPKENLITDINALNEEMLLLKKQILILEVKQNKFIEQIERLLKQLEGK